MANAYIIVKTAGDNKFHVSKNGNPVAVADTVEMANAIVAGVYMMNSNQEESYDVTYIAPNAEPVILASNWIEIPRKIK